MLHRCNRSDFLTYLSFIGLTEFDVERPGSPWCVFLHKQISIARVTAFFKPGYTTRVHALDHNSTLDATSLRGCQDEYGIHKKGFNKRTLYTRIPSFSGYSPRTCYCCNNPTGRNRQTNAQVRSLLQYDRNISLDF